MGDDLPPPKRKPAEHVLNVVKGVLSTLPYAGGLASLIDDYVPKSTERAVWQALEFLNEKLGRLKERIRQEPDPDEFSDMFKSFMVVAQRSTRKEKLRAAAGILANALLKPGDKQKLPYTELDHFARVVESLSAGAIAVLGVVRKRADNRKPSQFGSYELAAGDIVPGVSETDPKLAISLMCELDAWDLLVVDRGIGYARVGSLYATNMPVALTAMGVRFVDHVLQVGEDSP